MNDLFVDSAAAKAALSPIEAARPEGEGSGRSERGPLSEPFTALAARFDKLTRHDRPRDLRDISGRLLRLLATIFPNGWERVRAAEMIDRCPARHMVALVGDREFAEKIANVLGFETWRLN